MCDKATHKQFADGVLTSRDLEAQGLTRKRIMQATKGEQLIRIGRGLYQRPDADITENHTLAQVAASAPKGVICLLSALQFHGLTTQNPWQVWLFVEKGARIPKLDYPPLKPHYASGEAFTAGVEVHEIEGVAVAMTCIAKTIADCFKYRNKVGIGVALEALRDCLQGRRATRATLHHYARICRVERVMTPYMEALAL